MLTFRVFYDIEGPGFFMEIKVAFKNLNDRQSIISFFETYSVWTYIYGKDIWWIIHRLDIKIK